MVSILEAAKYFVNLSYGKTRRSLTPLKLQKLLYLAQGWSFVWDNKSLFSEDFEAWQHGPTNVEVYNYFSKYGRAEISELEGINTLSDSEAEDTIAAIWRDYSDYSAFHLVELTHEQSPWKDAENCYDVIDVEDIKLYFQATYA